jgi:hypothetical protein
MEKNAWGAPLEFTSTQKAQEYRASYLAAVRAQPLCLGSYAFDWGSKQDATTTWYGMLLPDNSRLAAVDVMRQMWTGRPPAHPCPVIRGLTIVGGAARVQPNSPIAAKLDSDAASRPSDRVTWILQSDPVGYSIAGAAQAAPPTFPDAIVSADGVTARVRMPQTPGAYRLYAYVRDSFGGAAVANVRLYVATGAKQ